MSHIVIMRGLPGSGKSSVVEEIRKKLANIHSVSSHVVSADHFFEDKQGNYNFDPAKLSEAHETCFEDFYDWCDLMMHWRTRKGIECQDVCFVDNTNMKLFEMAPYVVLAKKFKIPCHIVEMWRPDDLTPVAWLESCVWHNKHGVPRNTITRMWSTREQVPPFWPEPLGAWHHPVLGFEQAAQTVITLGGLV